VTITLQWTVCADDAIAANLYYEFCLGFRLKCHVTSAAKVSQKQDTIHAIYQYCSTDRIAIDFVRERLLVSKPSAPKRIGGVKILDRLPIAFANLTQGIKEDEKIIFRHHKIR
jgi:hypothetical protein